MAKKSAPKKAEQVQLPDPSIAGRAYTPEQIKAVLDAHYRWLKGETGVVQADLRSADLRSADLTYADLTYADLRYADLRYAKNSELVIASTRILPEGDLIGWKKCKDGVIVKLRIPESAKRSHAFGRKCRAEFAEVLEVIGAEFGVASHDGKTEYRVGQTVKTHEWCEEFTSECAGGIHFYITKIEAENH